LRFEAAADIELLLLLEGFAAPELGVPGGVGTAVTDRSDGFDSACAPSAPSPLTRFGFGRIGPVPAGAVALMLGDGSAAIAGEVESFHSTSAGGDLTRSAAAAADRFEDVDRWIDISSDVDSSGGVSVVAPSAAEMTSVGVADSLGVWSG
jgi:hypothetical protein